MLIHDAQYTRKEIEKKAGWGHSSFDQAQALAKEGKVKQLVFFHHDPSRTDGEIEAIAKEFPGAVALISHDRCLMDNVCTQILGLGTQTEEHLFADYAQWEAARAGHPDQWDRSPAPHRGRPAPGAGPRLCDLDGCGREHEAGGLCDMHRARKRTAERNGTPDDWDRSPAAHRGRGPGKGLPRGSAARPPAEPKLCATGDGQPVEADGLCGMHYRRKRTAVRNGTPDDWDRSPGARRGYSGGRGKPRGPRRPA